MRERVKKDYIKVYDSHFSHTANKALFSKTYRKEKENLTPEEKVKVPYLVAFGKKTRLHSWELNQYPQEFIMWE